MISPSLGILHVIGQYQLLEKEPAQMSTRKSKQRLCFHRRRRNSKQRKKVITLWCQFQIGGRAEFRNVAGVVTNVDDDGGYRIGTSQGILKGKYARAEFIPSIGTFLKQSDVPDKQVAKVDSMGDGQGYIRCNCKEP